eukprot:175323-Pyramimonas_sp.AAC.1
MASKTAATSARVETNLSVRLDSWQTHGLLSPNGYGIKVSTTTLSPVLPALTRLYDELGGPTVASPSLARAPHLVPEALQLGGCLDQTIHPI